MNTNKKEKTDLKPFFIFIFSYSCSFVFIRGHVLFSGDILRHLVIVILSRIAGFSFGGGSYQVVGFAGRHVVQDVVGAVVIAIFQAREGGIEAGAQAFGGVVL